MAQKKQAARSFAGKFCILFLAFSLVASMVFADESAAVPTKQDWDFSDASAYPADSTVLVQDGLAQLPLVNGLYASGTPFAGYTRRRAVTVDNTVNASTYSNYAVRVNVTYDSDMQSDFDDIRFTAADGVTELSYFLESKVNGVSAVFWVKVPTVTASAQTTLYMYYGNAGVSTTSNGSNVFTYFDDFETFTGWTVIGAGVLLQSLDTAYHGLYSGKKDVNGDPNGVYKELGQTVSRTGKNWIVETFVRRNTPLGGSNADRISIENSASNGYGFDFVHGATPTVQATVRNNGNATVQSIVALPSDLTNDWYLGQILLTPTTYQARILKKDYTVFGQSGVVTHSANVNLTREVVRGGFPYYLDSYRVREYVANEPTTSVGAESAFYTPSQVTVRTAPVVFDQLFDFSEALGSGNAGSVSYELGLDSNNDSVVDAWYTVTDGVWTVVTDADSQFSSAADINAAIPQFSTSVGTGQLFVKAYLRSDGSQAVQLDGVTVSYNRAPEVSSLTLVQSSDASHGEQVFWTPSDPNAGDAALLHSVLEYSVDEGTTWNPCSLLSGLAEVPGTSDVQQSDTWLAGTDLPADTDLPSVLLRITVSDPWIQGSSLDSDGFPLDFTQPALSAYGVHLIDFSTDHVKLGWTPVTDSNFSHYEVWYSENAAAEEGNDPSQATVWDSTNDPALSSATSSDTDVVENPNGYYFGVRAVDSFGNTTFLGDLFVSLSCHHHYPTQQPAPTPPPDSSTVDQNQNVSIDTDDSGDTGTTIDTTVDTTTEEATESPEEQQQEEAALHPETPFQWNLPAHWSLGYLQYLEQQKVVQESINDDPVFVKLIQGILSKPDYPISRLDGLHFAMTLEGYDFDENVADSTGFSDFSADRPLAGLVQFAHQRGLISGYEDGSFRPDQALNRAEAVTFLYRIFGKENPYRYLRNADLLTALSLEASPFCDVDLNAWYAPYLLDAYVHGAVQGNTGTFYYPDRAVTRAEFVKMALLIQHLNYAAQMAGSLEP